MALFHRALKSCGPLRRALIHFTYLGMFFFCSLSLAVTDICSPQKLPISTAKELYTKLWCRKNISLALSDSTSNYSVVCMK